MHTKVRPPRGVARRVGGLGEGRTKLMLLDALSNLRSLRFLKIPEQAKNC